MIFKRRHAAKPLRAVQPSAALEAAYRRKLDAMIAEMAKSALYWARSAYKANPPEIAQDDSPASDMQRAMAALKRRWQRRFNKTAPDLARYFAQGVADRSDTSLKLILKRGGFTVEFDRTRAANDVIQAAIHENVALIKSIPQQYLLQVEGSVMRSVQAGRDLATLSRELQQHYGVTKRRAATIARDQNNKSTGAMQRVRQIELGVTQAIWMHSSAGKTQRPSHVKMNGKKYDVAKGMWDPDEDRYILPGELINCRCSSRSIVLGFE